MRCDASKPVAEDLAFFKNFLGREDKAYMWFGRPNNPSYIYNLAEPVQLVDSRKYPGVQIADIWASALGGVVKRVCSRSSLPGVGKWPGMTPLSWHNGSPLRATA